ncbi:uncharacterized protein CLUP02_02360 [Colletotrichum lupini]|uniref:Uncharacterized protein n=1 Tax=Colletotrichum lupini TaxID=145971 RepID=A0A9Q8SEC6_9PEZI|nr:uncharacterized protein CLUP02_02360 [Colletotrichum lupini]UQC75704.1 hypothetical protein CLUP02_02360 [Colletotrichum lupini]
MALSKVLQCLANISNGTYLVPATRLYHSPSERLGRRRTSSWINTTRMNISDVKETFISRRYRPNVLANFQLPLLLGPTSSNTIGNNAEIRLGAGDP